MTMFYIPTYPIPKLTTLLTINKQYIRSLLWQKSFHKSPNSIYKLF